MDNRIHLGTSNFIFDSMQFDLIPHTGAGAIHLGMTRQQVRLILGEPETASMKSIFNYGEFSIDVPAKDGYFGNELQIHFDNQDKTEYIEFSGRNAKQTEVFVYGIDVFKTPAPVLIKKISEVSNAEYDSEDDEIPYSYIFPEIDLSVWRQVIPDCDEQRQEVPESDQGKYFWTIGIGSKGYYSKV